MQNKKALEFSFAWIFAIFIGAVIIFLAIYAATRIVGTEQTKIDAETAKQIGILLNPLETVLEEGKTSTIFVNKETKIFNSCREQGVYGVQEIGASVSTAISDDSSNPGIKSSFRNKYLFSSSVSEGKKEFYVFSKPFNFPFKIADLMILYSDQEKYCFVNSPAEIKEEINKSLKLKNIFFINNIRNCQANTKKVCFNTDYEECDIIVSQSLNKVIRGGDEVYYVELEQTDKYALLYAAIFSEPKIYKCQLKRLMSRAAILAELYTKKITHLSFEGCPSAPLLFDYIGSYKRFAELFSGPEDLENIKEKAELLSSKNAPLTCRLF
ncbi:hypothetical protein HYV50_01930 [Candidatus Pacearchaeota archaeon]|nr:hypothetical protein [Candidatus Pacearchaeota archaeon]